MLWNACTWHELGDLTFFGPWTNLQGQSQNGLRLVTDFWQDWFHTFIPHTHDYRQHCLVAQHCRLELFQDSDFAGDLEDSISTSGGVFCIFGSPSVECARNRRQYPIVPQNLKFISLDAGLRMDGVPAVDLWDVVIEVSSSTNNTQRSTSRKLVRDRRPFEQQNEDLNTDWKEEPRRWSIVKCGLRTHKHTFFSRRIRVVHLCR